MLHDIRQVNTARRRTRKYRYLATRDNIHILFRVPGHVIAACL